MSADSPAVGQVLLVAGDADGLAALRPTREALDALGVPWTEKLLAVAGAGSFDAGGARALVVASADAVLPASLAASTGLPVIRVPAADAGRSGLDLLYGPATADLPGGAGVFATVAIGEAGAKNAALFAVSMLGLTDLALWERWLEFRRRQTDAVLGLPPLSLD